MIYALILPYEALIVSNYDPNLNTFGFTYKCQGFYNTTVIAASSTSLKTK